MLLDSDFILKNDAYILQAAIVKLTRMNVTRSRVSTLEPVTTALTVSCVGARMDILAPPVNKI